MSEFIERRKSKSISRTDALEAEIEELKSDLAAERAAKVIHVHHFDMEKHAESFNEGYEAAISQGLADDPALAQDWLDAHDAQVQALVLEEVAGEAEREAPNEPTAGATFIAHAQFLRARAAEKRSEFEAAKEAMGHE